MTRTVLLGCGILSSLLYVATNIVVAMQWPEYSSTSQTVSELSAVDAPTRTLWVLLGIPYTLLVAAFGCGVWASAGRSRPLHIIGGLLVVYGVIGIGWPFAPMHLRPALAAGGATLSDRLHITFAMVTVVLMLVAMGVGTAAFGRRFAIYTVASMVTLFVCGVLTGLEAPKVSQNLPTPLIGVWERINIGVFLLWIVVLAAALMRRVDPPGRRSTS
jgi:hypothetical protein